MKKCLGILLMCTLLLTACGQKEEISREALKEEIKAELAAEQAAAEAESAENDQTMEEGQASDTDVATLNMRDESALTAFIIDQYDIDVEQEKLQSIMIFQYVDLDKDGSDEVICYAPIKDYFYDIVVVTADNQEYKIMESDMEASGMANHKVELAGDFVIYSSKATGTGVSQNYRDIYTYHDGKLLYTGATLIDEGYVAQPPLENLPNGYSTETVGTMTFLEGENNYKHFKFETIQTGDDEWQLIQVFTFNAESGLFEIETLMDTRPNPENNTTASSSESTSSEAAYNPSDITVGQMIGGLTVSEINYIENDSITLRCEGRLQSKGVLTGVYDEMYEENMYFFQADSGTFEKPLRYAFDDWVTETRAYDGSLDVESLLDDETQNYLLEGNSLHATVTITNYVQMAKNGSEGGEHITVEAIEIEADENYIVYFESGRSRRLRNLTSESFQTLEGSIDLAYEDYNCVVIPMRDTVNADKTEVRQVTFEGENTSTLKLTILGELEALSLNNVAEPGEEGQWLNLGKVANTTLIIGANLPSDLSSVIVHGKYHQGEGYYQEFEVTLDDMRAVEAYDILRFN